MSKYVKRSGLDVDQKLADFIEQEAMAGLTIHPEQFWDGFSKLVATHMPENNRLLEIREDMQKKIDDWHRDNGLIAGQPDAYLSFLHRIGYLDEDPDDFEITTTNLDPEISSICGPQLVVPVSNARYALNAANARWGSLYDALYGTDAIKRDNELAPGSRYNPKRGKAVFERTASFLDQACPLVGAKHADVLRYGVIKEGPTTKLTIETAEGNVTLADPAVFVGYSETNQMLRILLRHFGLHIELVIDSEHPVGRAHPAHLADVIMESALTTIQDCEDSVAAVDVSDKVNVYRNWLGLMTGTLEDTFSKNDSLITRRLNSDRCYTSPDGIAFALKGRSLQLVRNVGLLMTSDAIRDNEGNPVGEGIMDAVITTLCAMHDLTQKRNSTTGSIYIVKPKLHGPAEVAFACKVFSDVETVLGLSDNTIKIGIMDEERRTSANLKACIRAACQRVFFINTGFLDRTGDEIHTSMEAGPVLCKEHIKSERWLQVYESRNVITGLRCGFSGRAQIGKGMWAKPDEMAAMLEQKINHPQAGANCAWVPSPTAATLHALHYHAVDVMAVQKQRGSEPIGTLAELFSMPVLERNSVTNDEMQRELDNNAQGILGYVVRWVNSGIGCSKVPDINNVALMEDRATCRISSQAIANWLRHGIVSREQVVATFRRMAQIVDKQNADDPHYQSMTNHLERSFAFKAALALAVEGIKQPSGYTEPILHHFRLEQKQQ